MTRSSAIDEFRSTLPIDNSLLIADIKNSQQPTERDILDVAVNARALLTLTTLACRELDRIQTCFELWTQTQELFSELCAAWDEVRTDPLPTRVRWLTIELTRLAALSADRREIYTVSTAERLAHAAKRADTGFEMAHHQRHALEPRGEHEPCNPPHVYALGRL